MAEKISDPRDPTAVYLLDNLGVVMLDRKAYREASPLFAQSMALIEAGAEVAPEDMPQLLRNYATSLERTGRKKEARAAMVRAGALARELPEDRASGAAVSVNELAQGR